MVKLTKKSSFAPLPPTVRATALVLGPDPKGKNFLYCAGNSVVIRDIANPIECDSYYEHQKPPTCAKYSHTGFYICSGDASGKVRIWDTTQKEHILRNEYQPLSGKIKDISWDGESKRIAVCGEGREKFAHVFFWDSGASVGELAGMEKSANSCDLKLNRPFRCAVASEDYSTSYYEGPPFKYKRARSGTRFANCVRFSPDGKYFATCNSDGTILLCDGKTGEEVGYFGDSKAHSGGVYSLCFSPDSTELLSASADKSCKIWNVESRQMLVQFVIGKEIVDQQLSCLWQGDYLLSVSLSGEINYLDRNNPEKPSRIITGHNKSISAATTKLGDSIFTASFDGYIVKWNPETGDGVRLSGKGHGTMVRDLAVLASANQLVSIGLDNKVRFTDCDTCQYSPDSAIGLDSEPASLSITNDEFIVVACEKEIVLIKDGKKLSQLPWKNDHPVSVAAHGSKIVATGKKRTGYNQEGQMCHVYEIQGNSITDTGTTFSVSKDCSGLAFSPDGAKLAVIDSKAIDIYELCDGFEKESKSLHGHSNPCLSLAWSPDSQHLVSGGLDSSLVVWDTLTEDKHSISNSHPKTVIRSVSWLNENTVVSAGEDATVKQWTVSF